MPRCFATLLTAAVLFAAPVALAEDDAPLVPTMVEVPGDRAVRVLYGPKEAKEVLVYLPGRCGDPDAPLRAFSREASARATLVVVQGDVACPDRPGRTRWSAVPSKAHERIAAALRAAGREGEDLGGLQRTLIGYSEGALRAESIAKRFPDAYPKVVLLASPRTPDASSFTKAQRVAMGVGTHDSQATMRDGVENLHRGGITTKLFLFPGARHGQYGKEGGRVMRDVFDWLSTDR